MSGVTAVPIQQVSVTWASRSAVCWPDEVSEVTFGCE